MDIVSLGHEVQGPERAVPEPILRLANFDNITINPKADRLLAEQYPLGVCLGVDSRDQKHQQD